MSEYFPKPISLGANVKGESDLINLFDLIMKQKQI